MWILMTSRLHIESFSNRVMDTPVSHQDSPYFSSKIDCRRYVHDTKDKQGNGNRYMKNKPAVEPTLQFQLGHQLPPFIDRMLDFPHHLQHFFRQNLTQLSKHSL